MVLLQKYANSYVFICIPVRWLFSFSCAFPRFCFSSRNRIDQTGTRENRQVMSRIEEPASREGLELLELTRAGLDAAMPAGKGAGAGSHGEDQAYSCFVFSPSIPVFHWRGLIDASFPP